MRPDVAEWARMPIVSDQEREGEGTSRRPASQAIKHTLNQWQ